MTARAAVRLALIVMATVLATACATQASAAFENTADSKEDAVAEMLDALWQRDVGRMERLAVSEAEFRKYVWPALPSTRAGAGGSADYWWEDLRVRSLGSLARTVDQYGGQRLTLESVAFEGGTADYGAFLVHREARLSVRDASGNLCDLRLFGSLVETSGGWKIYSYVID